MSQEDKTIPEGWSLTKIGDTGRVITGKTPSKNNPDDWGDIYDFITPTEIQTDHKYISDCPRKLSHVGYKRFEKMMLPIKSVIVTCIGSDMGKVVMNLKLALANQQINSVVVHKSNSSQFIYYSLKNSYKILRKNAEGSGSTMPILNKSNFQSIKIALPPSQEQKAIANALTAFDDKIENLRSQNNTLEKIAQTIFTEWFGKYQLEDELPEGWRIGEIGNLTEIKRGGSPRPIKDYISDSGYRWLKISDATATESPYIFNIKEHIRIEGLSKTTLKKEGSLVLSNSATPGMPKILAVDTCIHDGWMHFPSSIVSNEYLYLLFTHIRPRLVQQGSGSVFVNLKTDILRYFQTVIPPNEVLINFDAIIQPIFKKILTNSEQIQSLSQTRDTLLPKLMSGQLRVKNIETLELAEK